MWTLCPPCGLECLADVRTEADRRRTKARGHVRDLQAEAEDATAGRGQGAAGARELDLDPEDVRELEDEELRVLWKAVRGSETARADD